MAVAVSADHAAVGVGGTDVFDVAIPDGQVIRWVRCRGHGEDPVSAREDPESFDGHSGHACEIRRIGPDVEDVHGWIGTDDRGLIRAEQSKTLLGDGDGKGFCAVVIAL